MNAFPLVSTRPRTTASRIVAQSMLSVIVWLLVATGAHANDCDATQSQDICQPFVLAVTASPCT